MQTLLTSSPICINTLIKMYAVCGSLQLFEIIYSEKQTDSLDQVFGP